MKWEYKISQFEARNPYNQELHMEDWGKRGWELVTIVFSEEYETYFYYWKRPADD